MVTWQWQWLAMAMVGNGNGWQWPRGCGCGERRSARCSESSCIERGCRADASIAGGIAARLAPGARALFVEPRVDGLEALDRAPDVEQLLGAALPGAAHARGHLAVGEQPLHGTGQRCGIAGRNQYAALALADDLLADDLGNPIDRGADDGLAGGHSFQQRLAERLARRAQNDHVAGRQDGGNIVAVSGEDDGAGLEGCGPGAQGELQRAAADHQQPGLRDAGAEAREGFQQQRMVLVGMEARNHRDHRGDRRVRAQGKLGSHGIAGGFGKAPRVDRVEHDFDLRLGDGVGHQILPGGGRDGDNPVAAARRGSVDSGEKPGAAVALDVVVRHAVLGGENDGHAQRAAHQPAPQVGAE